MNYKKLGRCESQHEKKPIQNDETSPLWNRAYARLCALFASADDSLERKGGGRLVRATTLACWQQLHPLLCNQRTRDVAGGYVRSKAYRYRTGLGRIAGIEYHERFSA